MREQAEIEALLRAKEERLAEISKIALASRPPFDNETIRQIADAMPLRSEIATLRWVLKLADGGEGDRTDAVKEL